MRALLILLLFITPSLHAASYLVDLRLVQYTGAFTDAASMKRLMETPGAVLSRIDAGNLSPDSPLQFDDTQPCTFTTSFTENGEAAGTDSRPLGTSASVRLTGESEKRLTIELSYTYSHLGTPVAFPLKNGSKAFIPTFQARSIQNGRVELALGKWNLIGMTKSSDETQVALLVRITPAGD